jgi:hypothetical protein
VLQRVTGVIAGEHQDDAISASDPWRTSIPLRAPAATGLIPF